MVKPYGNCGCSVFYRPAYIELGLVISLSFRLVLLDTRFHGYDRTLVPLAPHHHSELMQ